MVEEGVGRVKGDIDDKCPLEGSESYDPRCQLATTTEFQNVTRN